MDDCREISKEKPFAPSWTFNEFKHKEPIIKQIYCVFISKHSALKVKKQAVLSDAIDLNIHLSFACLIWNKF